MSKSLENNPIPPIFYILIQCKNCSKPIPVKVDTLIPSCWYGYQCNCGYVTDVRSYQIDEKGLSNNGT
jgi:hypothetical protein